MYLITIIQTKVTQITRKILKIKRNYKKVIKLDKDNCLRLLKSNYPFIFYYQNKSLRNTLLLQPCKAYCVAKSFVFRRSAKISRKYSCIPLFLFHSLNMWICSLFQFYSRFTEGFNYCQQFQPVKWYSQSSGIYAFHWWITYYPQRCCRKIGVEMAGRTYR